MGGKRQYEKKKIYTKVITALSSPKIFFYTAIYFFVLVFLGTVLQKNLGLYRIQTECFSAFFYTFYWVPIPCGYSILSLMFFNLFFKVFFRSKININSLGTFFCHIGTLLILLSGFLTATFSNEGYITLKQ